MRTIYYSIFFQCVFITLFYFEIFLTCNFDSMSNFCFLFSFRPIESPWKAKTGLIWGIKGTFIINSVKSEDFCCKSSCNLTTFYREFLLWYCQFNSQHSQKTWTYLLIHCVKYVHVYCKSYVIWDMDVKMYIFCKCWTLSGTLLLF